jgi:hypothetical protein
VTIYHEYTKGLPPTSRESLIVNGWGVETPSVPTRNAKGRIITTVQTFDLDAQEFARWNDAKRKAEENCFAGFGACKREMDR